MGGTSRHVCIDIDHVCAPYTTALLHLQDMAGQGIGKAPVILSDQYNLNHHNNIILIYTYTVIIVQC